MRWIWLYLERFYISWPIVHSSNQNVSDQRKKRIECLCWCRSLASKNLEKSLSISLQPSYFVTVNDPYRVGDTSVLGSWSCSGPILIWFPDKEENFTEENVEMAQRPQNNIRIISKLLSRLKYRILPFVYFLPVCVMLCFGIFLCNSYRLVS